MITQSFAATALMLLLLLLLLLLPLLLPKNVGKRIFVTFRLWPLLGLGNQSTSEHYGLDPHLPDRAWHRNRCAESIESERTQF
jgi:hypothetical protein